MGKFPVFTTHGSYICVEPDPRDPRHLAECGGGEEFIYQSCTGNRGTVSFGGYLTFRLVPETEKHGDYKAYNNTPIDKGDGLFKVEVKTFPIDPLDQVDWVM